MCRICEGRDLSHGDPVAKAYLARCYALTHHEADARTIVAELEKASSERYISASEIAAVYAALSDATQSLRWLDQACEEHAGTMVYLNADRVWDPLRGDARFQGILKRVHLPAPSLQLAAR